MLMSLPHSGLTFVLAEFIRVISSHEHKRPISCNHQSCSVKELEDRSYANVSLCVHEYVMLILWKQLKLR